MARYAVHLYDPTFPPLWPLVFRREKAQNVMTIAKVDSLEASTDTQHRLPADPHEDTLPSVNEMINRISTLAIDKAGQSQKYFLGSLVGGAMVAFGVLLSVAASNAITAAGPAAAAMGVAFGFSLVLILVSNASLVTADMGCGLVAMMDKRLRFGRYLRMLSIGLAGNVIGTAVFIGIAAAAGGPYLKTPYATHIAEIATTKAGASAATQILLAVLCTWLLETAVFMFYKARSDGARMALAFYGPFAFVLAGTQHVIANVGFIGFALLLRVFHPTASAQALDSLTWGLGQDGLLRNLVFVIIGNWIGSALLGALPFYLMAKSHKTLRSTEGS
jgi:formate/nitrite transporter FocA (FNT family)